MELVVLGLKRKSDGEYFIYDVTNGNNNIQIKVGETKNIKVLSPFPFSNFSSLDNEVIDFDKFEKCYLKIEGDLSSKEYSSMMSSGIIYYRFHDRDVVLIEEFVDIFQYSLQMLNKFKEKLGTYDLTTWVMHNETHNDDEHEAMKKIIYKSVSDKKKNNKYPLDISLDKYTSKYISYFRELSNKGYNITFGRYGSCDRNPNAYNDVKLSDEDLLFMIKNIDLSYSPFLTHPSFTAEFYNKNIANKDVEYELINYLYEGALPKILSKGLDADEIYKRIFKFRIKKIDPQWYEYNSLEEMFNDENFKTYTEHHSPYDYYCCEDCDGYDIHEQYTEEELMGTTTEVDERLNILSDLLDGWDDYLGEDSYELFNFVPNFVLEKYCGSTFINDLMDYRKLNS